MMDNTYLQSIVPTKQSNKATVIRSATNAKLLIDCIIATEAESGEK